MSKFKDDVGSVVIPSELSSEMQNVLVTYIEMFYNIGYEKGFFDAVKKIVDCDEDEE